MIFWPFTLGRRLRELEQRIKELERNSLKQLGDYLTVEETDECPTLRLSGANLQIVNGTGGTDTTNGCGNLIIGYNAPRGEHDGGVQRSGSHNLVVGDRHNYTSYSCTVSGLANTAAAPESCVVGGQQGHTSAAHSVVIGGYDNKGNSDGVVVGGFDNATYGTHAVTVGGVNNRAEGDQSLVLGGGANTAGSSASGSTILGGSNLSTTTPGERIPP